MVLYKSIDEVTDYFGFGRFSQKLVSVVGTLWFLDGVELTLTSVITPQLRCEWNLTSFQTALASGSVFLGMGVGEIYWGWLGDVHGRKIMFRLCTILALYFALLSSVSNGLYMFILTRYFVGMGLSGLIFSPCYISEFIAKQYRGRCMVLIQLFFTFGSIFSSLVAYFTMNSLNWRIYLAMCGAVILIPLVLSFWLPESIKYLQATGNYQETMKILHFMSIENKKPLPQSLHIQCKESRNTGNISLLFSKKYFSTTLYLILLQTTMLILYFSVMLLSTEILQSGRICLLAIKHVTSPVCQKLTDNEYLKNMLVSLGEFPALLFYMFIIDRIDRRKIIFVGFTIVLISFICLSFCLSINLSLLLLFICRAALSGSSQSIYTYTTEIYPTDIRASGFGLSNAIGRWCVIASPFLVQILLHISIIAMTGVFIGMSLIGMICACMLKNEDESKT